MSGQPVKEPKQSRTFPSLEEEAALGVFRAHEFLLRRVAEFLKPYGLTPTQYNMLRILRGAGAEGVTCAQATERMLSPDPDITRLLDRLEARKLIRRERSTEDRRVVMARLAPEGLSLVNSIDQPITEFHKRNLAGVGPRQLQDLIETLEAVRNPQ